MEINMERKPDNERKKGILGALSKHTSDQRQSDVLDKNI